MSSVDELSAACRRTVGSCCNPIDVDLDSIRLDERRQRDVQLRAHSLRKTAGLRVKALKTTSIRTSS